MVDPKGIEPSTLRMRTVRSPKLSYGPIFNIAFIALLTLKDFITNLYKTQEQMQQKKYGSGISGKKTNIIMISILNPFYYSAGNFFTRITRRLRHKIIRHCVDNNRSAYNIIYAEAVGQKH